MLSLIIASIFLSFVGCAWILARVALRAWLGQPTGTLIRCDSCHLYTPARDIRFYAGDPVCPRCREELATDPGA